MSILLTKNDSRYKITNENDDSEGKRMNMESYAVFKDLAIIIIAAKVCGIAARKCKAPQVVGEIVAGLLIGPSILGLVNQSDFLLQMAEIGVILLMFSAGLETDLKDLLKTGPIAALIACAGVFIPLVCGALLYMAFYGASPWGSEGFYKAVFVGTILTATSVSNTVESLKEMGKLKGKVGTTILSAAIIDDVIGIIVLTFVIGFKNPDSDPMAVLGNTVCFLRLHLLSDMSATRYLSWWTANIRIQGGFRLQGWRFVWHWRMRRKNISGSPILRARMWLVSFFVPYGIRNT